MARDITASMSEILKLAERCEKATGPDRELDCLIFEARHLLLKPSHRGTIDGEPTGQYFDQSGNQLPERAPFYTASIDAAMTLVPEYGRVHFGPNYAEAGCSGLKCMSTWSKAATPALSLCAAALRATASKP